MSESSCPKVFISAVSNELENVRNKVKIYLKKNGFEPVEQEDFKIFEHQYTIKDILRKSMKDCVAMVHIVGMKFGFAPNDSIIHDNYRSYTQMEYDLAKKLGIYVLVFKCSDRFNYSDNQEVESLELQELQQKYRSGFNKEDNVFYSINESLDIINSLDKSINDTKGLGQFLKPKIEDAISFTELKASHILKDRANPKNKFNEGFYFPRDHDIEISSKFQAKQFPKILLTGKSMAGKTRSIFEFLKRLIKSNDYSNYKIVFYFPENIGKFISLFNNEKDVTKNFEKTIIVLDELYKCYLKSNRNDFEKAFSRASTNDLLIFTTCTSEEYIQINEFRHNDQLRINLNNFEKIKVSLSDKNKSILKKYGYKLTNIDTIGELLGVKYPWESFDLKSQDALTKQIVEAIHSYAYIKKGHVRVRNILEYLNRKVNSKKRSDFIDSKLILLEGSSPICFDEYDLEESLNILCHAGMIHSSFIENDAEIGLDEGYLKYVINELSYNTIKGNILRYCKSNKNIARLIAHLNADEASIKNLPKLAENEAADIIRVHNAYAQKICKTFIEAKAFFDEKKIITYDISALKTLSRLLTNEEDNYQDHINFILSKSIDIEDITSLNEDERKIPLKIEILNNLLYSFSETELNQLYADYKNDQSFSLKDYFNYNALTYVNILKRAKTPENRILIYDTYGLSGNFDVVYFIVSNFSWNFEQYKIFIENFKEAYSGEDAREKILVLFNKSLGKIKCGVDALYNWGITNQLQDDTSLNVYLGKTVRLKAELLRNLLNNSQLKNVRLINTCIKESNTFFEAKSFINKNRLPDDYSFNFLSQKITNEEDYKEVIDLMKKHEHVPFLYTYSTLIEKLSQIGFSSKRIFDELFNSENAQNRLNSILVGRLMRYSKSYEDFLSIEHEIKRLKINKDRNYYAHLIRSQEKFYKSIKKHYETDELNRIIHENIDNCLALIPDIYIYRAILDNPLYKNFHLDFFKRYTHEFSEGRIKFDSQTVINFVKDKNGFYEIFIKLEPFPAILNGLSYMFLSSPNLILDQSDIAEVIIYIKEYRKTLPGKLLVNIFRIKRKEDNLYDIYGILKEHANNELISILDFNNFLKDRTVFTNSDEKYKWIKSFIEEQDHWKIKPDEYTYAMYIQNSPDYEAAEKIYKDECVNLGYSSNHRIKINLLNKTETLETFQFYFDNFIEEIFGNNLIILDKEDINSIFDHRYVLVMNITDKERKIREIENQKEYEINYGYRLSKHRISLNNKYSSDSVSDILLKTSKQDHRNINVYNSIFKRCKSIDDAQKIFKSINEDTFINPNFETISNLFYRIHSLKDTGNYFRYFDSAYTSYLAVESNKAINVRNGIGKQIMDYWLEECSSIDDFRVLKNHFPYWEIIKRKNYWLTNWYKAITKTIKNLSDANLFYNSINTSLITYVQIWDIFRHLKSREDRIIFIEDKKPDENKIGRLLKRCKDIEEFILLHEMFSHIKLNICNMPWYNNIYNSITTAKQGIYFFESHGDKTRDLADKLQKKLKNFKEIEAFNSYAKETNLY